MFPSTPTVPESCDPHGLLPEMVHAKDQQQRRKDFGRNGTYLVFRKLAQHVGLFRDFLTQNAPPGGQDLLAAKLVGRWASGAPLTLHPTRDPGIASNDFGYHKKDRNGFQCPIGAHIRRANPRDDLEHDSQQSVLTVERHRILRRGVLYGPRLLEGKPDDGQPRGLLFICLNADIRRQFEFIQQTWLNNPKFAGLHNDRDPIVGANREPGQPPKGRYEMIIQQETVRKRLRDLPRFVTMRGGGYFFLPGIKALRFLISLKPDHVSVPTEPFADTSGD